MLSFASLSRSPLLRGRAGSGEEEAEEKEVRRAEDLIIAVLVVPKLNNDRDYCWWLGESSGAANQDFGV